MGGRDFHDLRGRQGPANDLTPGQSPAPRTPTVTAPLPAQSAGVSSSPRGLLRPGPLPPSREGFGFTDLTLTRNLIPLILRGTLRRGHPPPSRGQGPRPGS